MAHDDSPSGRFAVDPTRTALVVDDDDATRTLTVKWLSSSKITCIEARTGEAALQIAATNAHVIDAIVLDVMMPGINGFETVRLLKQNPATALIPVVLLTAHATGEKDILEGVEGGASDHLTKPFSGPVLVAKVRAICDRSRTERDLHRKLRQAEANATIDSLTGLYNRRAFEGRLREEIAYAKRHRQPLTIIFMDLDHFSAINNDFGHLEGDRVLAHFAETLRGCLRTEDAAFRYGGEEFVVLMRGAEPATGVLVAERLRGALKLNTISIGEPGIARAVTFSGGVAAATLANEFRGEDLVARADVALYKAKDSGRDRIEIAD